jgi:hypothetical protein
MDHRNAGGTLVPPHPDFGFAVKVNGLEVYAEDR